MKKIVSVVVVGLILAGCMSYEERIAAVRITGVQELDSFLGVKLGSSFPGDNDVVQSVVNGSDALRVDFVTDRKFVSAAEYVNFVQLTSDGKVYRIKQEARFCSRASAKRAAEIDAKTPPTTYAANMNVVKSESGAHVSGTLHNSRTMGQSLARFSLNQSFSAMDEALKMLKQKYGKEPIKRDQWTYVVPFKNNREIVLVNDMVSVGLFAVDLNLEKVDVEKRKKSTGRMGADAL